MSVLIRICEVCGIYRTGQSGSRRVREKTEILRKYYRQKKTKLQRLLSLYRDYISQTVSQSTYILSHKIHKLQNCKMCIVT